jgi:glycosyltransferase involved in cell wall biosynthesis
MLVDDSVHEASGTQTGRAKIAWLSPFPPQRSGIANYSYSLIKALSAEVDIDLFSNEQLTPELAANFVVRPLSAFPARFRDYDDVIYHLGNHAGFHKRIYELAWQHPATIVLHDYNLSGFMREAFYSQHLYRQAIRRVRLKHNEVAERQAAMSHAIVDRSRKVIVHHRWARNEFAEHPHVAVIPHFAQINYTPTNDDIARFRQRFGLKDDHFIITCLGFVNLNKLPTLQIEVVKQLLSEGYPVQLVFAGEPAPEVMDLLIQSKLDGCAGNIIWTGFLDEVDYFSAIFTSDIVINLRNPTMGESSGTLAHTLAAGRPTIVSDVNQYKEFPDTVCWKLSHDAHEKELLLEYMRTLLREPRVRDAMSINARNFVANVLGLDKVALQWLKTIGA